MWSTQAGLSGRDPNQYLPCPRDSSVHMGWCLVCQFYLNKGKIVRSASFFKKKSSSDKLIRSQTIVDKWIDPSCFHLALGCEPLSLVWVHVPPRLEESFHWGLKKRGDWHVFPTGKFPLRVYIRIPLFLYPAFAAIRQPWYSHISFFLRQWIFC